MTPEEEIEEADWETIERLIKERELLEARVQELEEAGEKLLRDYHEALKQRSTVGIEHDSIIDFEAVLEKKP